MSEYKHLKECSIASQKKEIAESYARVYSKRMPRDKKPLLTLNFKFKKPVERPGVFIIEPGIQFIQKYSIEVIKGREGEIVEKIITLFKREKIQNQWEWRDLEGTRWTESFLINKFTNKEYTYLGHQKL